MAESDVSNDVAEAIERRRNELGLTVTQMVQRSGLTAPGLLPLRKGERRNYADVTKFGLAKALNWPLNAVDRLLSGEMPDETWDTAGPDGELLAAIGRCSLSPTNRGVLEAVYFSLLKSEDGST